MQGQGPQKVGPLIKKILLSKKAQKYLCNSGAEPPKSRSPHKKNILLSKKAQKYLCNSGGRAP